jgi:hypothetical protein
MNTVHNARITQLATIVNNLAAAFIIAGFVAPTVTGQFPGITATFAWFALGAGLHSLAQVILRGLRQ